MVFWKKKNKVPDVGFHDSGPSESPYTGSQVNPEPTFLMRDNQQNKEKEYFEEEGYATTVLHVQSNQGNDYEGMSQTEELNREPEEETEYETTLLVGEDFEEEEVEYETTLLTEENPEEEENEYETTLLTEENPEEEENEYETTLLTEENPEEEEEEYETTLLTEEEDEEYETTLLTEEEEEFATTLLDENDNISNLFAERVIPDVAPEASLLNIISRQNMIIKKSPFRIGSDTVNIDFYIGNPTVSRHHAHIVFHDDAYYIIDNNSTNKTILDGAVIEPNQPTLLYNGALIQFSDELFQFNVEIKEER